LVIIVLPVSLEWQYIAIAIQALFTFLVHQQIPSHLFQVKTKNVEIQVTCATLFEE